MCKLLFFETELERENYQRDQIKSAEVKSLLLSNITSCTEVGGTPLKETRSQSGVWGKLPCLLLSRGEFQVGVQQAQNTVNSERVVTAFWLQNIPYFCS